MREQTTKQATPTMNKEAYYSAKADTLRELLHDTYFVPAYHGGLCWDSYIINKIFSTLVQGAKGAKDNHKYILFQDRMLFIRNNYEDKSQPQWHIGDGRHRIVVFSLVISRIQRRLLLHLLAWKEATANASLKQKSVESTFIAEFNDLAAELDGCLVTKDGMAEEGHTPRITLECLSSPDLTTYMEGIHLMYSAYQTQADGENSIPQDLGDYAEIIKAIDSNLERLVEAGELAKDGIAWHREQVMQKHSEEEYQALVRHELYKKLVGLLYFTSYLLDNMAFLIYRLPSSLTNSRLVAVSNQAFGVIGVRLAMGLLIASFITFIKSLQRFFSKALKKKLMFLKR